MSGFKDLSEILEPWLDLPISGKTYRVHAVDGATGLRMQAIVELAAKVKAEEEVSAEDLAKLQLDDDEERDFNRSLLGETFDQMMGDKVPWVWISRAARTTFMWTVQDKEAALEVWSASDDPKPRKRSPQDRKPKAKKASKKAGSSPSGSTARQTPA